MSKRPGAKRRNNGETAAISPLEKLTDILDIPPTAFSGVPQIELAGNREAVIDGCQGILEYDEDNIKIATGKMAVRFTGRGLQIKVLTHDSAVIEGFIRNIEFMF